MENAECRTQPGQRHIRHSAFGIRHSLVALTLIEVMVVVMILGMIAAVVSKIVMDRVETARAETAKTQISEFMGALDLFYLDNSFYPSTEQGLQALVAKPTSGRIAEKYPDRGYITSIPKDPWRHEYVYVSPGTHADYEIVCLGRDGAEGGDGYDADIASWDLSGTKRGP